MTENMKCPKCYKQAISLLIFIFKSTPRNIKCKNCSTELKFNKFLHRGYLIAVLLGILLGAISIFIKRIFGWSSEEWIFIFFISIIFIGAILEYILWTHGGFELADSKLKQNS